MNVPNEPDARDELNERNEPDAPGERNGRSEADLPNRRDGRNGRDEPDIAAALERLGAGLRRLKGIGDAGDADAVSDEIPFDEWDWEIGVGLYGELRRAETRGTDADLERIERWYARQIARGLPRRQVNSTAPMLALALLERRRTGAARELVRDWSEWLVTSLPRAGEGGFQHTVKERDNDGELWDDTLFMAVLFVAVAGTLFERDDWIEEAHYQFLVHLRHLGDVESGLFFHGWTFRGRHHFARARWCRGNAWITLAIPELFRLAPPAGAVRRQLASAYRTQAKALRGLQREDGMFHTLLDDATSPVEASGTAGIACGLLGGLREGLLDAGFREPVARARAAILARIGEDGLLADVSDGTPMGRDLDFYRRIPNLPTPYGQALASLFLIESLADGANGVRTARRSG